jgi:hypothetical protein
MIGKWISPWIIRMLSSGFLRLPVIDQKRLSSIPLQLALSPVVGLPIRIGFANMVTVQCLHDTDPREHWRAVRFRDQDQRLDRGLPFGRLVLGLRKLGDEVGGVLQRDELEAAGQRYWFIEPARPSFIGWHAFPKVCL